MHSYDQSGLCSWTPSTNKKKIVTQHVRLRITKSKMKNNIFLSSILKDFVAEFISDILTLLGKVFIVSSMQHRG